MSCHLWVKLITNFGTFLCSFVEFARTIHFDCFVWGFGCWFKAKVTSCYCYFRWIHFFPLGYLLHKLFSDQFVRTFIRARLIDRIASSERKRSIWRFVQTGPSWSFQIFLFTVWFYFCGRLIDRVWPIFLFFRFALIHIKIQTISCHL